MEVLDDLRDFCRLRRVRGQICLTGGDPMRYSHFWHLYAAISGRSTPISVLGNPLKRDDIARLMAIQPPIYYQVSLEGLPEHNDAMRGNGHFDQAMTFLVEARRAGLPTHVMLTLTAANMEQVLPLGRMLRGLTIRFTFNRLAQVGGGRDFDLPDKERYAAFLQRYLAECRHNPVLGMKDNLLNIVRWHHRRPPLPGCTGFGCGAAFNFVALLPDGEVHACRKFPSKIGDIHSQGLSEIYRSDAAKRYRSGSASCRGCSIRRYCGGCLATTHGAGLDPFQDRDPQCFMSERSRFLGESKTAKAAT